MEKRVLQTFAQVKKESHPNLERQEERSIVNEEKLKDEVWGNVDRAQQIAIKLIPDFPRDVTVKTTSPINHEEESKILCEVQKIF